MTCRGEGGHMQPKICVKTEAANDQFPFLYWRPRVTHTFCEHLWMGTQPLPICLSASTHTHTHVSVIKQTNGPFKIGILHTTQLAKLNISFRTEQPEDKHRKSHYLSITQTRKNRHQADTALQDKNSSKKTDCSVNKVHLACTEGHLCLKRLM